MKVYIFKQLNKDGLVNKLLWSSSFALATAAFLTACGDETTNVTETTGPTSVAQFDDLDECTVKNEGGFVYVKDSAAAYLCTNSEWKKLSLSASNDSDGEGVKGPQGECCSGTVLKNGNIQIKCGDKTIGELKNGADGMSAYEMAKDKDETITDESSWIESLKGKNGENCTIKDVDDGVEITCNEVTKTITNGSNGTNCSIVSDKDGVVTLKCGDVETELYKAVCGATPYDPAKKFCVGVKLYDLCGGKAYDPAKEFCYGEVITELCGTETYDPTNQFCAKKGTTVMGVYKKATIGKGENAQTWMAENLNFKTTEGSYCYGETEEDPKTENCTKYGRLYTWATAVGKTEDECGYGKECNLGTGKVQGICPDGWHLPSEAEFEKIITNVDATLEGEYADENVAGNALKLTSSWNNNGNETDDYAYGFSALLAGYKNGFSGEFLDDGRKAHFWSATEDDEYYAYDMLLTNDEDAFLGYNAKNFGYSVRCIQDKR